MPNQAEQRDGEDGGTSGVDEEAIRARAYEIFQREDAGSPAENWERATAELAAERVRAANS